MRTPTLIRKVAYEPHYHTDLTKINIISILTMLFQPPVVADYGLAGYQIYEFCNHLQLGLEEYQRVISRM